MCLQTQKCVKVTGTPIKVEVKCPSIALSGMKSCVRQPCSEWTFPVNVSHLFASVTRRKVFEVKMGRGRTARTQEDSVIPRQNKVRGQSGCADRQRDLQTCCVPSLLP